MSEAVAGQIDIFDLLGDTPAQAFTAYATHLLAHETPCGWCGQLPKSLAETGSGGGNITARGGGRLVYTVCGKCAYKPGQWNPPPRDQWTIKEHP